MAPTSWMAVALLSLGALRGAPLSKATCATCHTQEAHAQGRTGMGIGIELPPDQKALEQHPHLTAERNGYTYIVERQKGQSTYTVKNATGELTLPVRYAFGAGNLTFVLEYQGRFYESLMSYYTSISGLAITMGDEQLKPRNLVEAMGREVSENEIASCFNCHSTGAVHDGKLTLASLSPGLRCEHCHAGAEAHQAAMQLGKTAPLPAKLGDMAAEDMSNFCGQCHRTWETVVGQRLFGPRNVRFQPYRLENSKCFLGDDRRIRCTACHNPHQELVRDDKQYDAVCQGCHGQSAQQKPCPVGSQNCVSCHMPKVRAPGSQSVFTDHYIRVVRNGENYPD